MSSDANNMDDTAEAGRVRVKIEQDYEGFGSEWKFGNNEMIDLDSDKEDGERIPILRTQVRLARPFNPQPRPDLNFDTSRRKRDHAKPTAPSADVPSDKDKAPNAECARPSFDPRELNPPTAPSADVPSDKDKAPNAECARPSFNPRELILKKRKELTDRFRSGPVPPVNRGQPPPSKPDEIAAGPSSPFLPQVQLAIGNDVQHEDTPVAPFDGQRGMHIDVQFDQRAEETPTSEEDTMFVTERHEDPLACPISSDYDEDCIELMPPRKRKLEATGDDTPMTQAKRKPKRSKKEVSGLSSKTTASFTPITQRNRRGKGSKRYSALTKPASIHGTNSLTGAKKTTHSGNRPSYEYSSQRRKAMNDLIASFPEENKKISDQDLHDLEKVIESFRGDKAVEATPDGYWLVKGMKTPLFHYQVLGVGHMLDFENREPRGGILADEMGLGKTVQMLALITNAKPGPESSERATLLVCTPALATQWFQEIQRHCHTSDEIENFDGLGPILTHRSGSRIEATNPQEILSQCSVVITTYREVLRSFPKTKPPAHLFTTSQKELWWSQYYTQNKGLLHRVKFHRVVLDEAHAIKNHESQTAKACWALQATHHWALTGTPISNRIEEFYSYFKFLREPHAGSSFRIFKENFCSPDDPDGTEKLNMFLRKLMIRRVHTDTFANSRLVDMPPSEMQTVWLQFNGFERQVYEIVQKHFVQRLNQISTAGQLEKNYKNILTMILRLRQVCDHFVLVQEILSDLLERDDFEKLVSITRIADSHSHEGAAILAHLRQIQKHPRGAIDAGDNAVARQFESEFIPAKVGTISQQKGLVGGIHGLYYDYRKYLMELAKSEQWSKIEDRTKCGACHGKPLDPVVTSCYHIYCSLCLETLQNTDAQLELDRSRCKVCGETYTDAQECEQFESFVSQVTTTEETKGKKKNGGLSWLALPGPIVPSTKTLAVKTRVLIWLEEDKDRKIIIFTQFRPMLRILEKVCDIEGWRFCRYSGDMTYNARIKSIEAFSKPGINILLMSLQCGGVGLNLTMATHVILFEPWWNSEVEFQAFCRAYRIGQTKQTAFVRYAFEDTIEHSMMTLKKRKRVEINKAVNNSMKADKLDAKVLMRLFGPVVEKGGKPFVFASGKRDLNEPLLTDLDEDD